MLLIELSDLWINFICPLVRRLSSVFMLIQIQVVSKVMLIYNQLGEVGVALSKWTWICHWIMLYCKICWLISCTIRIRGPSSAQFHVHRWSTPIRLYFFTLWRRVLLMNFVCNGDRDNIQNRSFMISSYLLSNCIILL